MVQIIARMFGWRSKEGKPEEISEADMRRIANEALAGIDKSSGSVPEGGSDIDKLVFMPHVAKEVGISIAKGGDKHGGMPEPVLDFAQFKARNEERRLAIEAARSQRS